MNNGEVALGVQAQNARTATGMEEMAEEG